MPPTDEHVVDEQRADDERVGDASSVSSERKQQREEHGIEEKKLWRSKPQQQSIVIGGLDDNDGGEDGIRDGEQRNGSREAGAPVCRPRCGQQRRCMEAEGGGSSAVRRSIVCFN